MLTKILITNFTWKGMNTQFAPLLLGEEFWFLEAMTVLFVSGTSLLVNVSGY